MLFRIRCALLMILCLLPLTILPQNSYPILRGAGATFPHPLYSFWMGEYKRITGQRILYEAIGSGQGIELFLSREVDFGATDIFLSNTQLNSATDAVLHIPTCIGAIAVTYFLPGAPTLYLTPQVLAAIFSGKIHNWQHPEIRRINPETPLPDLQITVIHRSESSGTTFLFSDYLSKVDTSWQQSIGNGKLIRWPVGLGVEGNPGIVKMVQRIPGSIGYVTWTYAIDQQLPVARLQNSRGEFIAPSAQSLSKVANIALPNDMRLLLTNSMAACAYPISAFSYLLIFKEQSYGHRTKEKAQALKAFLHWIINNGQAYNSELNYAPLPENAVMLVKSIISEIRYQGEPFE